MSLLGQKLKILLFIVGVFPLSENVAYNLITILLWVIFFLFQILLTFIPQLVFYGLFDLILSILLQSIFLFLLPCFFKLFLHNSIINQLFLQLPLLLSFLLIESLKIMIDFLVLLSSRSNKLSFLIILIHVLLICVIFFILTLFLIVPFLLF